MLLKRRVLEACEIGNVRLDAGIFDGAHSPVARCDRLDAVALLKVELHDVSVPALFIGADKDREIFSEVIAEIDPVFLFFAEIGAIKCLYPVDAFTARHRPCWILDDRLVAVDTLHGQPRILAAGAPVYPRQILVGRRPPIVPAPVDFSIFA